MTAGAGFVPAVSVCPQVLLSPVALWGGIRSRMAASTVISSTANPRIKEARKLQRRRGRSMQKRLLIEGLRLVRDAWESGAELETVFYVPEQVASAPPAAALIDELAQAGVTLMACTPAVFATLAETLSPQGIAAVTRLPHLPLPEQVDFVLVLDGLRDPGNAGTLMRTAEAAGVDLVIFGPETVDAFNDKVLRAGMGAHFRLPLRSVDEWAAVAEYTQGCAHYVAAAEADLAYDAVDWTQPAALIVGSEAEGARPAARASATPVAIPMVGRTESLNAAVAGAVILFEAARQRRRASQVAGAAAAR